MRTIVTYAAGILLVSLIATPVWADEEGDGDVTMEVVSDADADESEFVDEIELPAGPSDAARTNTAFGIDTANEARTKASEDGRAFGESTSREAREQGRDAGNAARAREGAGAGDARDGARAGDARDGAGAGDARDGAGAGDARDGAGAGDARDGAGAGDARDGEVDVGQ